MAQPKFIFKLESLLEHRKMLEKEQQKKVTEIQSQAQVIVNDIQASERKIAEENKNFSTTALVGNLDMQYIAHGKKFVGMLHVKIAGQIQQLKTVEQKLAQARVHLLAAARARKVIEKLREKQFARWREEQDRKDAALMDEIGTRTAIRAAAEEAELEALAHVEGER